MSSTLACGLRLSGLGGGFSLLLLSGLSLAVAAAADPPPAENTKTCLLVIDVQEFYFPGGSLPLENPEAAGANCARLLKKFRDEKQLVVHVGHQAPRGAAFHADVTPREGEKIVMKSEVSAFNGTDLLQYLRDNKVGRLVICGMQTHMCVEGAVRAAHDLGFTCILVPDACATRALTWGDRTVAAADVHASTLATLERTYATVVDTKAFLGTY